MFKRGFVRPPGDSFATAITKFSKTGAPDPAKARKQHAAYCKTLSGLGLDLTVLDPTEEFPDGCFTDDTAVLLGVAGLLCRPGVESRQGEVELIAPLLEEHMMELKRVEEPGTLEGGDVFSIGASVIVGRSTRTNDAGILTLRRFVEHRGGRCVMIDVPKDVLHLQSVVTALSDDAVIGRPDVLDQPAFANFEKVPVTGGEQGACNVVALGDDIVMGAGYPKAAKAVKALGFKVHTVDISEFKKADAGVSCLVLLA